MEKKLITLQIKLRDPKGKFVDGIVVIKDCWAISSFKHPTIAKELFDKEKNNKYLHYDEEKKLLIQEYPNKTKEDIYNLLRKEFLNMGAQFTKQ